MERTTRKPKKWVDNINMDLGNIRRDDVEWTDLARG
jgi:hypothetical protein